ncbi:hypothetical protein ACWEIJ_32465 [Lentzea sp. NPDC004789]
MRSRVPLPTVSLGVALVTVGVLAGVAMSAGVVPVPLPGPGAEPDVAQEGGDQPPMEFAPDPVPATSSSAVRVVPGRASGVRVVVTPPPHSNPVVTPESAEPRASVVETTAVPSVSLPGLSSEPLVSSSSETPDP